MTCGRWIEESVQLPTAFAQIVYCRQNKGPAEKEKETEKREAWTTAQDTEEQSDWERSALQSSKAQHCFSGFALAARDG